MLLGVQSVLSAYFFFGLTDFGQKYEKLERKWPYIEFKYSSFGLLFQQTCLDNPFAIPDPENKGPRIKQTMYKHVSNKSVFCLCSRSCLHQAMKRPGIFPKAKIIINDNNSFLTMPTRCVKNQLTSEQLQHFIENLAALFINHHIIFYIFNSSSTVICFLKKKIFEYVSQI